MKQSMVLCRQAVADRPPTPALFISDQQMWRAQQAWFEKNRNADLPPEIGFCFCKTECGRFDEVANDPRGAKTSAGLFSVGSSESYCNSHYDEDANFLIALIWFSARFYFIPSKKSDFTG